MWRSPFGDVLFAAVISAVVGAALTYFVIQRDQALKARAACAVEISGELTQESWDDATHELCTRTP